MSEHTAAPDPRVSALERWDALTAAIRAPVAYRLVGSNEVYTFTPDLTAAEAQAFTTTIADLSAAARTRDISLTLAEYRAIKPALDEIRSFRTRTAAQWGALTVAQRVTDLIQYDNDLTDVLRALLRQ